MSRRVFVRNLGGTPTVIHTEAINLFEYGAVGDGIADDTNALQAAIDNAIETGSPLRVPTGRFNYTPPLTIDGNITVRGDGDIQNWDGDVSSPVGTPPLLGSVLCPTSNGQNAIDISGISLTVNLSDFGIEFQTPFSGTGHGISYPSSNDVQGLSGSSWRNLSVFGTDGDHYAFTLTNLIYNIFTHLKAWGGGFFDLFGDADTWNYGNTTFVGCKSQLIAGGTAMGINLRKTGAGGAPLNVLTFIDAECVSTFHALNPGNPPLNTQSMWISEGGIPSITLITHGFESSVGATWRWEAHPSNNLILHSGHHPLAEPTLFGTPGTSATLLGRQQIRAGSSANAAGTATISFTDPLAAVCIAVVLGPTNALQVPFVSNLTTTGFDLTQANGGTIYYIAYGY